MPYPSTGLYPKTSGLYPGAGVPEYSEPPDTPAATTHGAVEKLQPGRYMLRHIAPLASSETAPGVYRPLGAGFAVLGQTLYAEPLPQQRLPSSPDFHEGKYTLRLYDAGDYSLSFPNRDASDGRPWRERFSQVGHREFIEISREGIVEQIGCIVKRTADRQKVTIEGYDGFFLLKKAFEQSWTQVMGPRDVIERYTELPVVWLADEFKEAFNESLYQKITAGVAVGQTVTAGNGLVIKAGPSGSTELSSECGVVSKARSGPESVYGGRRWSMRMQVDFGANLTNGSLVGLRAVTGTSGVTGEQMEAEVRIVARDPAALGNNPECNATLVVRGPSESVGYHEVGTIVLPKSVRAGKHTLLLEADGRWVYGYVDGVLVGVAEYTFNPVYTGPVRAEAYVFNANATEATTVTVTQLVARAHQPFLMRGASKGEIALPGTAATYPTGGLHGRWMPNLNFNTALAPNPNLPGFPNFIETQEAVNIISTPPGIQNINWAARWFGAVYLKAGVTTFQLNRGGIGIAMRCWVGQTGMIRETRDPLMEDWSLTSGSLSNAQTFTAERDGWYPIIVEAACGAEARSIGLLFTPPVSYTDPGGTALTGSAQVVVPTTSLSPLGCVDARIQGSSFFDIVNEQAKNFGYQVRCEPRQLESGEFPGRIVPKARLGKDTDEIIEAGDIDRRSEVNNYTATLDATDSAVSIRAFGSGIADGKGSQVAYEAMSFADEKASLFDMQAWLSAGDIAFPQLLAARANAELGLRTQPWENVDGEPIARDRLADTFPLTGALSQFHWQPSDGLRLKLPDVGIDDTAPRQILQVVRNFTPEGRTSTQVGFRARPKDPLYVVREALRDISRPARAYQGQYASRATNFVQTTLGAGVGTQSGSYVIVTLQPTDRIIAAQLVVSLLIGEPHKYGIRIMGGDQTANLGGPWERPATINLLSYMRPSDATVGQRIFIWLLNKEAAESGEIDFQLILTLLV